MKKISIKERLILYFVLLSVISIAIVSLFSIFEAKKGIRERAFSQLILLRDIRREQIQAYYSNLGMVLNELAATDNIRTVAESLNSIKHKQIAAPLITKDSRLIDLIMEKKNCQSLYFLTKNGQLFQFSKSGKELLLVEIVQDLLFNFRRITKELDTLSGYKISEHINDLNESITFLIVPVGINENDPCAVLIMDLNQDALYSDIFSESSGTGLGKTGEAYLAGLDGYMRTPSRFIPGAVMTVRINTFGFNEALSEKDGNSVYDDYRGVKVLGAFGQLRIGDYKQVILAEIDVSEAMVPLSVIRNDILMVSSLLLLLIFAITWFLAYGITRPLVRLKSAANFISAGNYNQKLEVEANDEIGDLTEAFNAMSSEINTVTMELMEKEQRLRHFYEATLDGIVLHDEGKMILYNSAMLRLTGYAEKEFEVFTVKDILRTTRDISCKNIPATDMYESVLILKDKSNLPVEVQESCVDFNGKNVRATVIRDISSRKKMEAELADERNKRIRAVFDGKDIEQQRLSRELHDGLGQQLVAGKLILERSLYDEGINLKAKILETQNIFDQIIGDIRRISHDLSPSILKEFGLKAAMDNLCRNIMKATELIIDFRFNLDNYEPDELTSMYLFRIAQESLNNVQVHSGAAHVRMNLQVDNYGMLLEIEDDGCGFDLKKVPGSGGNGLYNIRERVHILKGQLNINSKPGKGTQIHIRIPSDKSISA